VRRLVSAVVGVVGVLVLSGSQTIPAAANFVQPLDQSLDQAQQPLTNKYAVDLLPLAQPFTTPTALPSVSPSSVGSASNPYGLSSAAALTSSGIPEPAYRAYVNAASELARTDPSCQVNWSLIAGIGRVESNHGRYGGSTIRSDGLVTPPILGVRLDGSRPGTARIRDSDGGRYDGDPVYDRAVGPMQFLPGTWKIYGAGANPQNMNAAALATGRYLCAGSGSLATQQGRWAAVYRYNHSDSYVSLVLSIADSYASGHVATFPSRPAGTPAPDTGPPATTPGPPPAVPTKPVTTPTKPTPTTSPTTTSTASPTTTPSTSPTTSPTPTPSTSPTGTPSPTDTPTPTTNTSTPTPTPTKTSSPSTPSDSPTSGASTPSCSTTPTATPTSTPTPTSSCS
jgi:hypothetical protein